MKSAKTKLLRTIFILLACLTINQQGHTAAQMYRENVGEVHKVKGGVIAVGKSLSFPRAVCDPNNFPRYILSEKGMGVKPLVLGGTPTEILEALATCPEGIIENQSKVLPDIYMGIVRYRFGKGWKGLFPMQDFMQQFAEQVTKIGGQMIPTVDGPGHTINDIAGNFGDFFCWLSTRRSQGTQKIQKTPKDTDRVYMKFSYLQEEGMELIGTNHVMFKDILRKLYLNLKPLPSLPANRKQVVM